MSNDMGYQTKTDYLNRQFLRQHDIDERRESIRINGTFNTVNEYYRPGYWTNHLKNERN